MEVVWAIWAMVKFFAMVVSYGVVAVMWCVHHVGLIAVAVGMIWVGYNLFNPADRKCHANWYVPALLLMCGAGVAHLQW